MLPERLTQCGEPAGVACVVGQPGCKDELRDAVTQPLPGDRHDGPRQPERDGAARAHRDPVLDRHRGGKVLGDFSQPDCGGDGVVGARHEVDESTGEFEALGVSPQAAEKAVARRAAARIGDPALGKVARGVDDVTPDDDFLITHVPTVWCGCAVAVDTRRRSRVSQPSTKLPARVWAIPTRTLGSSLPSAGDLASAYRDPAILVRRAEIPRAAQKSHAERGSPPHSEETSRSEGSAQAEA